MSDDAFWRRPPGGAAPPPPAAPASTAAPYTGAPRSAPPPRGWRPQTVDRPLPPRQLPAQDVARIEREEQAATILTKGVGLVAGAVLLVVLFILCGRLFF